MITTKYCQDCRNPCADQYSPTKLKVESGAGLHAMYQNPSVRQVDAKVSVTGLVVVLPGHWCCVVVFFKCDTDFGPLGAEVRFSVAGEVFRNWTDLFRLGSGLKCCPSASQDIPVIPRTRAYLDVSVATFASNSTNFERHKLAFVLGIAFSQRRFVAVDFRYDGLGRVGRNGQ